MIYFCSKPCVNGEGVECWRKAHLQLVVSLRMAGKKCYPSQACLAAAAEMSIRQVQRYLQELREYGLIDWERRQNKTNVFYIKDLSLVKRLNTPDQDFIEE